MVKKLVLFVTFCLVATLHAVVPTNLTPAAAQAAVVCSWVDTGTDFNVSWDPYPGGHKYVIYRTVDGAGPHWRGAINHPGTSLTGDPHPNQGHNTVTYEVAVKDATNTEIDRATCTDNTNGGGQDPGVVCSWVDAGTDFNVSWDPYPGGHKYVIYRTVDGAGPHWRGAINHPGTSLTGDPHPNQGHNTVTYEVAVKDATNTEIDRATCTDNTNGGGPVGTTCTYAPMSFGVSINISPEWGGLAPVEQIVQRNIDDGGWVDRSSIGATDVVSVDETPIGAQTSWAYRVDARDANGSSLAAVDCGLSLFPPGILDDGVPPVTLSQAEAETYEATTGNNCTLTSDWQLWDWDTTYLAMFPPTQAELKLALWLPQAPAGYMYQATYDATVEYVSANFPANKSGYYIDMIDVRGRDQQGGGKNYMDKAEGSRNITLWGEETDAGWWFADGGYIKIVVRNWYGGAQGASQIWELGGPDRFSIHLVPVAHGPQPLSELAQYPTVEPPANPCLAFYPPDHPGLGYPNLHLIPQLGWDDIHVDWIGLAGAAWDARMEIAEVAIQFVPLYDCADALVNGFSLSNVPFCIVDMIPVAGVLDDGAYFAARNADEIAIGITRLDDGFDFIKIDNIRAVDNACSFTGDTNVLMADGTTTPISQIAIGDRVLSADPETGERGPRRVRAVWSHDDEIVDLQVGDGVLSTTEDHRFWNANDQQWQRADALDPGESLLTADGDLVRLGELLATPTTAKAYNLTVAGLHTYFVEVGGESVLVHNDCFGWTVVDEASGIWESPAGLRYGRDPKWGHRTVHVIRHGVPMSNPSHSVFDASTSQEIFELVDEAWTKKGAREVNDQYAYVVDMGRPIGTDGERYIRIITENPGVDNNIASAYPTHIGPRTP